MFQQLQRELESALKKIQVKIPNAHTFCPSLHTTDNNRVSVFVHFGVGGCEHYSNLAELERFAITPEYTNPVLWRKFEL